MTTSYFEIGGHIVECNSDSLPSPSTSPSSFRGAPTNSRSPAERASESNNSGGRKGEQTTVAYTPYSYGNPLVWAASQVLMRIAQSKQRPGADPITGKPNLY